MRSAQWNTIELKAHVHGSAEVSAELELGIDLKRDFTGVNLVDDAFVPRLVVVPSLLEENGVANNYRWFSFCEAGNGKTLCSML